jgi:hypothetical protein
MPLLGAGFRGQRVLDGLLQRHRPALGPGKSLNSSTLLNKAALVILPNPTQATP